MGIFPLFIKKDFFSALQQEQIIAAIRQAEQQTSGEIRLYAESKNPMMDPVERAKEIFYHLKMENTKHRNGVLVYVAYQHKELALFADDGIYTITGKEYWEKVVKQMLGQFFHDELTEGIISCINHIGQTLKEKFPFEKATDKNELPDEIVFGK